MRPLHDAGTRPARGEVDRPRDALRSERAVRHHAELAQAQQEGAALGLRVDGVAQPAQRRLEQQAARLGPRARRRRVAHRAQQGVRGPLHDLEEDVAGEAVGHDHVGLARPDREALDVAREVQPARAAERRVGRLHVLGPLRRLGAVGEQGDARALDAEHRLHEGRAHVRELDQVLGPHLDVRAAVQEQERPPGHRDEHGQRRPVDAARSFHVKQAGGEGGAGRAAGDERVGVAAGHGPDRLDDRGLGRRADGTRRVGGLRDRDGGVDDLHARGRRDLARRPEDEHADVAARGREGRAARDLAGAGVGPVRVERDRQLLSGHGRQDP